MKNKRYLKYIFLIPMILLAFGAGTNAQSIVTGAINGTVTDASGAVVEGANVTLVSEATQETRTAVTGPGGTFQFSLLKP
jgi:type 1 fimbria pilin